ncbi:hypothetical protein PO909_031105 [Leuciscus waleckii]
MAQSITPQTNRTLASVGQKAILSCKYEGTITNLHWYRQYSRSKPEFLVYGTKEDKQSDVNPRFTAKHNKEKQNHVDLEISSATVSDSAVYYCVLQPTVTGNTRTLYNNLTHVRRKNDL